MKTMIFVAFLVTLFTASSFASVPPIEPGISRELAKWRKEHYSNISYKLDLSIKKMSPTLDGTIEISVLVKDEKNAAVPIILDWRKIKGHETKSTIKEVTLNGKSVTPEEINEHLVFKTGVVAGDNKIKLSFSSPILKSGAAITRYIDSEDGSEYIYSLFVPADASTAFPLFDQPDLKARFNLSVTSEIGNVVSNTPALVPKFDAHRESPVRKVFLETQPISSYVFAFAAGAFSEFQEKEFSTNLVKFERRIVPVNDLSSTFSLPEPVTEGSSIYVRKSQAKKFKPHAKEVFRLNRESVKYFEKYFDFKFPFPKYDIILIPEFPFGGMEHAGATFLRERSVIFPSEPTANNYIARASVIFHEAAHQWFGDTVTMEWFDDLWLKEGFATFMANKAMKEVLPQYNSWKTFYERTKPGAYATDVTKGTTPIYQEIPNLNSAKSAYGNIVYQKAPSFLKQAEFYLGEKEFQEAVRLFLRHSAYSNADWELLVVAFETTSKKDLTEWAQSWVKTRGLPVVRVKKNDFRAYPGRGKPHSTAHVYTLEQEDALGEGGKWPFKTKVLIRLKNGEQEIKDIDVSRQGSKRGFARYWVALPSNPNFKANAPVFIFPNFDDKAYGVFLLDPRSQRYALENIGNEKDDFLRSMMWGALWDSVRFAELDPSMYIELAVEHLSKEKSDTTIASILGRVGTAYTYYLSEGKQKAFAPKIESLLMERMKSAKTNGQLLTYFRSYRSLAGNEKAKKFLYELGSETGEGDLSTRLQGLQRKRDRFSIATRLISLGDKRGELLLKFLESRFTDDASKRYAYGAKAARRNAQSKAKYFKDFTQKNEISESWIEDAFRSWNSPGHSKLTLPYLQKALAELPNIKRDRKIFFVNGWVAAFIGGQKSDLARSNIIGFLEKNPNLDADLQRKILERIDGLERAVKIRAKYGESAR